MFRMNQGETHFFFSEKKKRFSISKKNRQGAFYKAAPLEPLLKLRVKPHRNKKDMQILFVVPRIATIRKRANATVIVIIVQQVRNNIFCVVARERSQHLLHRHTTSATTKWSACLPPKAARGQSEAAFKQVSKGRLALGVLFSTEIANNQLSFPRGKESRLLALPWCPHRDMLLKLEICKRI